MQFTLAVTVDLTQAASAHTEPAAHALGEEAGRGR